MSVDESRFDIIVNTKELTLAERDNGGFGYIDLEQKSKRSFMLFDEVIRPEGIGGVYGLHYRNDKVGALVISENDSSLSCMNSESHVEVDISREKAEKIKNFVGTIDVQRNW